MPIYLYGCCGKEVEVIQGITQDDPVCPDCGVKMLKKPTSPTKIEIKGTGGVTTHSKGYKEGYSDEYKRRLDERLKIATS